MRHCAALPPAARCSAHPPRARACCPPRHRRRHAGGLAPAAARQAQDAAAGAGRVLRAGNRAGHELPAPPPALHHPPRPQALQPAVRRARAPEGGGLWPGAHRAARRGGPGVQAHWRHRQLPLCVARLRASCPPPLATSHRIPPAGARRHGARGGQARGVLGEGGRVLVRGARRRAPRPAPCA